MAVLDKFKKKKIQGVDDTAVPDRCATNRRISQGKLRRLRVQFETQQGAQERARIGIPFPNAGQQERC